MLSPVRAPLGRLASRVRKDAEPLSDPVGQGAGARKAADDIGNCQTQVNALIKVSVGLHRVYAAPLIEPPAL